MSQTIQDYATERGIQFLYHFTRLDNISSILENGLLTRDQLVNGDTSIFNDELRLDLTNAICTSIAHPNYKMFYRLRCENESVKWVVIQIKPEVLWELRCAFYANNAASNEMAYANVLQRQNLTYFQSMYEDQSEKTRTILGIPDRFPTNPQAEVLILDNVPTKYINEIYTNSESLTKQLESVFKGVTFITNSHFFLPRSDFSHWK